MRGSVPGRKSSRNIEKRYLESFTSYPCKKRDSERPGIKQLLRSVNPQLSCDQLEWRDLAEYLNIY